MFSRSFRRLSAVVFPSVLLASMALMAGCGGKGEDASSAGANAHAQAAPAAAKGAAGPGGTKGEGEEPGIPVAVRPARVGPIASHYAATATLEAEKEAQVLARVSGPVTAILCEEGDFVREGQELLTIEDDEYRVRLQQAKADADYQQSRFARTKQMFEQSLVSEEVFEETRSTLASAQATSELADLNLSYTHVTAPFAGRIVRRAVDVGQNVSVGTHLFTLSDFNPLLARVQVPAKEFRRLQADQPVELVLDSDDRTLLGHVTLVSPVIDPQSGTIKVTVEIPEYPEGTRPGDFAEVRIVTEKHDASVLVPKNAVFTEKGEEILYVAADGKADRRVVKTGFRDADNVEVLEGVSSGELVVVKGQRSLEQGAAVEILDDTVARNGATAGGGGSES
jgi:membrane fusion protein (multidrug efflux system)